MEVISCQMGVIYDRDAFWSQLLYGLVCPLRIHGGNNTKAERIASPWPMGTPRRGRQYKNGKNGELQTDADFRQLRQKTHALFRNLTSFQKIVALVPCYRNTLQLCNPQGLGWTPIAHPSVGFAGECPPKCWVCRQAGVGGSHQATWPHKGKMSTGSDDASKDHQEFLKHIDQF